MSSPRQAGGSPSVLLIGTGSEVQVALDARHQLQADGIPARVVSMPCLEWFAAQDPAYRDTVLPPSMRARVSVEAGITSGWEKIIGDAGRSVGVEHYGASADYQTLYHEFGITADAVAAAARDSIHDARARRPARRPRGHLRPERRRHRRPARLNGAARRDPTPEGSANDHDAPHDPLAELSAQGVAVWLDDLSRELLATGALQSLITSRHVVGVTTNPTIFASALSKGDRYDDAAA